MDVEPEMALEETRWNQGAVGTEDDRLARQLEVVRQPLGLQDRNPEAHRRPLGRGRLEPAAATSRSVRSCQAEVDVMPRGQSLENVGTEGSGGRDADARH